MTRETGPLEPSVQALAHACLHVHTKDDLDAVAHQTMDVALAAAEGHIGFLALINDEESALSIRVARGQGWDPDRLEARLNAAHDLAAGITGQVAVTRRPYRTDDVASDPYYVPFFDQVVAEIAVPILDTTGRIRGVINVETDHVVPFTDRHEQILCTLSTLYSTAAALYTARRRQEALVRIGLELAVCTSQDEVLNTVLHVAGSLIRFEDCSIFLKSGDGQRLTLAASSGPLREQVGRVSYTIGEGLTGWVAQHQSPLSTGDPRHDARWRGLTAEIPTDELGAFMAVPIPAPSGLLGVLRVVRSRSRSTWLDNTFSEEDVSMLASVASQLGAALHGLHMRQRLVHTERMAAWGELSARSAHMIGNRTFALRGDINELKHLLTLPVLPREELQDIVDSAERGLGKLDEILREFRDFVVATQLSPQPVDLNALVKQGVEEAVPKRSPVHVELRLADNMPTVVCDPGRIKRCLAELIENALSLMPDDGRLTVYTDLVEPNDSQSGIASGKAYARITVEDTGPGVPAEIKQRIFEPFYTSRARGMGLGLSIVKGIVDAHMGQILEDGDEGAGARFRILLPVSAGG